MSFKMVFFMADESSFSTITATGNQNRIIYYWNITFNIMTIKSIKLSFNLTT